VKVKESIDHDSTADLARTTQGANPLLLQCTKTANSIEDVLADLPTRGACDRLISRCFASVDHLIGISTVLVDVLQDDN
jgi:hypothetical protein